VHQYIAIATELFTGAYLILSATGNILTRLKNPKAKAIGSKMVKVALEIKTFEEKLEELQQKEE
jgi:hypothetical protein